MKLLSKKTAVLAMAALVAVGTFIAAPSAEAHDRDRGWRDRDWGGWSRHDRGNHYGWRNNHNRGWSDRYRGPRHHYNNSGWWGNRRYESRRYDWRDRRYYR